MAIRGDGGTVLAGFGVCWKHRGTRWNSNNDRQKRERIRAGKQIRRGWRVCPTMQRQWGRLCHLRSEPLTSSHPPTHPQQPVGTYNTIVAMEYSVQADTPLARLA